MNPKVFRKAAEIMAELPVDTGDVERFACNAIAEAEGSRDELEFFRWLFLEPGHDAVLFWTYYEDEGDFSSRTHLGREARLFALLLAAEITADDSDPA